MRNTRIRCEGEELGKNRGRYAEETLDIKESKTKTKTEPYI